ncbi:MAG: hypothetical protein WB810_06215 [Candidatus Cybelea sp.]
MNTSSTVLSAILASVLTASATGCSGGSPSQASIPLGPSPIQTHSLKDLARSGRSPKALLLLQFANAVPHAVEAARNTGLKDLYISGYVPEDVTVVKNTTYKNVGTITKGLVSPDGDFVDAAGNLYVADYDAVDVQEYKPGGKSPSFTYNAGMVDPVNVSVDSHGNVYEADYDGHEVNEYVQKTDTVVNSCRLSGFAEGVAVDANNDVFVTYNETVSGTGKIVEYKGGLAGCNKTSFNIALDFAGGIALDAKGNLIVCDENAPAVDVIAPPYSTIKKQLGSGYMTPFHVTLNKSNKRAFVADTYDVYVHNYPSGSLAATIGSADGLTYPAGAVDSENAVY